METNEEIRTLARKYWASTGLKSPKNEAMFVETCAVCQLDPYKREVYAIDSSYTDRNGKFHDGFRIITGYEVYLKRAERTGKLDGWSCHCETENNELVAKLTVYRKDWKMPFIHEVYWSEAVQTAKSGENRGEPNSMWSKMGRFMLRKVAIAQGFRLCFPDELGGMPYTADELSSGGRQGEDATILPITTTPTATEPPQQERKAETKPKEEPKPAETAAKAPQTNEDAAIIERYLRDFSKELEGKPTVMAQECLKHGGDTKAMIQRIQSYLERKGIRI